MIRASIPTSTRSITLSNSMLSGTGYAVTPNAVQLTDLNEVYYITGTTSTYGISVLVDCTIILDDVSITSSATGVAGIELNSQNVTITLNAGSNNTIVTTGNSEPAIRCVMTSSLVLNRDGALTADSSNSPRCAGIGGRGTGDGGRVTISENATVTAIENIQAAGIGGGDEGNGGVVTIKDTATVTATGNGVATGIGNGGSTLSGSPVGGTINISGGTVVSQGYTGIGGGTGNINLSGGVITTTGTGSVGIGDNNTATVNVTGGTISTQGDTFANGIDGAAVIISGGNLLSKDGTSATPSSSIFSNTTTNVYQNIFTVPGITSSQPITAFSTTDGVSYLVNGSETITDGAQEVLAVWLPSTTTPQAVCVTIGGTNYKATYVRPNAGIAQMLTISAVPPATVSVTGVTLDKSTLTLLQNSTETITTTVQPSNATDKSVTWSSSDTNIATVDAAGVVTGKNVGTATITATTNDGGYSASCTVTVSASTYTVTPSTLTFTGGTSDLTFKVNEPAMTELQSVTVDGAALATSNYTVTSGSTVITLKNSWLTAQSDGTYAIIANFTNGKAGITLTINQSSTSSGSSSSTSSSTGNTGGSGGSTGGTNTSKDFWYPNSSGTTSSTSGTTSANSGSATSPDSPNYNPVTGGE